MKLVVGVSGASGVIYAIRLLETLKEANIETHLVMSTAARETIVLETEYSVSQVESLASQNYRFNDISSALASGSFRTDGMVIIPCSMKTLAGVASGYADNLILRAAEVTLKEKRPLIMEPRETPLTTIHIENMLRAARAGATILPAMPGFYSRPRSLEDIVNGLVSKVLDQLRIDNNLARRWQGPKPGRGNPRSTRRVR